MSATALSSCPGCSPLCLSHKQACAVPLWVQALSLRDVDWQVNRGQELILWVHVGKQQRIVLPLSRHFSRPGARKRPRLGFK